MGRHVNRGKATKEQDSNCGMCTIAALLNTDTSAVQTLFRVNGQSDDHLAFGLHVLKLDRGYKEHDKVRMFPAMCQFVVNHRGNDRRVTYEQHGTYDNPLTVAEADNLISSGNPGTEYAVWACMDDPIVGAGAHWNYAITTDAHQAEFRDYQDDDGTRRRLPDNE